MIVLYGEGTERQAKEEKCINTDRKVKLGILESLLRGLRVPPHGQLAALLLCSPAVVHRPDAVLAHDAAFDTAAGGRFSHDLFIAMYVTLFNAKRVHARIAPSNPALSFDVFVWSLAQL